MDHYYNLLIDQEREKYNTIYQRYKTLENVEKNYKEAELKLLNTERLAREQMESRLKNEIEYKNNKIFI